MKCSKVSKKILLLIDGALPEDEKSNMLNHVHHCSDCADKMKALRELYSSSGNEQDIGAPPFLWEKLYLKITDYEENYSPWGEFLRQAPRYAATVAMLLIFAMAVLVGVYLGNYNDLQVGDSIAVTTETSPVEEFVKEVYIDSFDDIPSQSVAGVYLTLKAE